MSNKVRNVAGSPRFSGLLLFAVLVWLAVGPLVDFSRAWELAATAGAAIIGLILLVVIQHTQNRDDKAIQLKLNEVIRASEHVSDGLISIEDSPEVELSLLLLHNRHHAEVDRRRAASPAARSGLRRWFPRVDGRDRLGRRQRRYYAWGTSV
jgi:low affinity Fe/Cu permease